MAKIKRRLLAINPFTEGFTGDYFVGRDGQLRHFDLSLNGLMQGIPNHYYVSGLNGTGKTSYLDRVREMANTQEFLGVSVKCDSIPPFDQMKAIIRKIIVDHIEYSNSKGQNKSSEMLDDWSRGEASKHFNCPRESQLQTDLCRQDFDTIRKIVEADGYNGIVVCIDEGQRLHAQVLSALKNSLQGFTKYLMVLSLRVHDETGGVIEAGRRLLEEKCRNEGDEGASAFFRTGISMGPFSDSNEAASCIKRRLDKNEIQFDDKVVIKIGEMTGRIPRPMIQLANEVYNFASTENKSIVDSSMLQDVFNKTYSADILSVQSLCENISPSARNILKTLLGFDYPPTAKVIAEQLYGNNSQVDHELLIQAVTAELDRICNTDVCRIRDDKYVIPKPTVSFALKTILGVK